MKETEVYPEDSPASCRYFLKFAYDGTNFHGWQRQPNANSVQQTLEEALATVLRKEVPVTGAGRTDTGVHARVMFAHFDSEGPIDKARLLSSLDKLVGRDIAVYDLLNVRNDAHARFDALSRSYSYYITLRKDPFAERFAHRLFSMPDIGAMNDAAKILLSTADFTSFAKLHSDSKTNICKVSEAFWRVDENTGLLVFNITADRFLRNMVRAVVGTLLEVGQHKLNLKAFENVITMKDRCAAGTSMPAKGLFLTDIKYPKEIFCHE